MPSCSPFITIEDEKPQQLQSQDGSQEVTAQIQNDLENNFNFKQKVNLSKIPHDEKPSNNNNDFNQDQVGPKPAKRQPRSMENRSNLKVDFLKSDDIFG